MRRAWIDLVGFILRRRPEPPTPAPVALPPADPPDEEAAQPAATEYGPAEGQSFMIEYRDSRGSASRRRITVWSVQPGAGGTPCLYARCHERAADRSFRCDRITAIITGDGEVLSDVRAFLGERLGVRLDGVTARADRWPAVLAAIRPQAQILTGLALADGRRHEAELRVVARSCGGVAAAAGFRLTAEEEAALDRYLRTMRPSEATLVRAIDRIAAAGPAAEAALLDAAEAVIAADGVEHPEERRFLVAIRAELGAR
jgi:tellurite resistance protein